MKRLTLLLAALWLLLPAPAALAAPGPIAVVDMVELIEKHPRANELSRLLDQRKAEAEAWAMQEQQALRELQGNIEMMGRNNPMRRVREKEFVTQSQMLKLELKWREDEALREYMDGLEGLYAEIQRLVARYAREQAIQIVLIKADLEMKAIDLNDYGIKVRLRSVVYHDETLDITTQIKAMFPAPAPGGQPAGGAPTPPR